MQGAESPCPRCESPQVFAPRTRPVDDGKVAVFIRCTGCRFEEVLRISTKEIERLRRRIIRLEIRQSSEIERHGCASNAVNRMLRQAHAALDDREAALR